MNNFLKIVEKKISENVSCEKILLIDNSHKHKKHKFFDKNKYDLVGWQSIDIYQNLSITFISSIVKNIEIDENLFKLPKQD